jgi:hypothetical protein
MSVEALEEDRDFYARKAMSFIYVHTYNFRYVLYIVYARMV